MNKFSTDENNEEKVEEFIIENKEVKKEDSNNTVGIKYEGNVKTANIMMLSSSIVKIAFSLVSMFLLFLGVHSLPTWVHTSKSFYILAAIFCAVSWIPFIIIIVFSFKTKQNDGFINEKIARTNSILAIIFGSLGIVFCLFSFRTSVMSGLLTLTISILLLISGILLLININKTKK